jgi:hypothetical protein
VFPKVLAIYKVKTTSLRRRLVDKKHLKSYNFYNRMRDKGLFGIYLYLFSWIKSIKKVYQSLYPKGLTVQSKG